MVATVGVIGLLQDTLSVQAQSRSAVCRTTIILDRSGSVANQLRTMQAQVRLLFEVGGVYDDHIKLAFWSFAADAANGNYNAPFSGFVSSYGRNAQFDAQIQSLRASGNTNYEQAFAYHNGAQNKHVADIANQSDLLVFITDGEPNPANTRLPARTSVQKYYSQEIDVIGGLVGTTTAKPYMNYVINGSESNSSDTFFVRSNYSDLSDKLKEWIQAKCYPKIMCEWNAAIYADDANCKPPEKAPYSLTPSVVTDNTVISGIDSAAFKYTVVNDSTKTASEPTDWSIKRVIVDRGQSVDPLSFTTDEQYRDAYNCEKLLALVNNKGDCSDSGASGHRVFGTGTTTLSVSEMGAASGTAIEDDWQVGTKVCYVLIITQPTQRNDPQSRSSRAACAVIGKRPTFQVHGGDISVGRRFVGDAPNSAVATIRGSVTAKAGALHKTFGSWGEYGIFAPGTVSGVASAAGLQGGYEGMVGANQELWSTLTFANVGGTYGHYTRADGMGIVTDMVDYFTRGRQIPEDLATVSEVTLNGDSSSGLYRTLHQSITLHESSIEKGKTIILYVPDGTVTIDGNIYYADGRFASITELPQLVIIARDIIIKDTVTRIDAWLLAQDSGRRGGSIVTCDKEPPLSSELCSAPLTINGPVVAKQLLLRRTGGSGAGQASGDPAEIINLRADAYLWAYTEGRSALRAETTSTVELPPQF
ncbi:MAG: vWA domain-containing protein [Candidatus Saccharimonadales bacterium]